MIANYNIETSQSGEQLVHFELHVSLGEETWTISKRYSDFGRLRDSLIAECVGGSRGPEYESDNSESFLPASTKFSLAAELPPKTVFVNLDLHFINGRRAALQHYLDLILAQQCVSVSFSMFAFLSKSEQQSKTAAEKTKVEHQQACEAKTITIKDVSAKAHAGSAAAEAERRAQEARATEAADVKAAAGTCHRTGSKSDDVTARGGSGSATSQTSSSSCSSSSLLSPSAAARRRHVSPTPPIGSAAAIAAHFLAVKAAAAAATGEHGALPSDPNKIASPQTILPSSLSFLSEPPPSRRSSGGSQSRSRGGRNVRLSSPPATRAASAFVFGQASASKPDTTIPASALSAAVSIWPVAAAVGRAVASPPPKSSPEANAANLQRTLHAALSLHSLIGKGNGT